MSGYFGTPRMTREEASLAIRKFRTTFGIPDGCLLAGSVLRTWQSDIGDIDWIITPDDFTKLYEKLKDYPNRKFGLVHSFNIDDVQHDFIIVEPGKFRWSWWYWSLGAKVACAYRAMAEFEGKSFKPTGLYDRKTDKLITDDPEKTNLPWTRSPAGAWHPTQLIETYIEDNKLTEAKRRKLRSLYIKKSRELRKG